MPYAVAAAAVATIGGAIASSDSSRHAANVQADSARQANDVQLEMFREIRNDMGPYLNAGNLSLSSLLSGLGLQGDPKGAGYGSLVQPFTAAQFQKSPGYDFQMQQGLSAVQNSAAARGGLNSGNTLRALTQYGQGVANQDWYNAMNSYYGQQNSVFNKLDTLAGSGQNAAANLGALGSQTASSVGGNLIGAGNAQAAGIVGASNAIGSGLGNLANIASLYQNSGRTSYTPLSPYGGEVWTPPDYAPYADTSNISDRRAKTDIEPAGKTKNGLKVYSYRLKGTPQFQLGLMADEVERVAPGAVKTGPDGYKRVNYMKALMAKAA